MDAVQFAVLGLGVGAAYALLGQGVVLIYRGSGILNFAQGAIGMFAAELFYILYAGHQWPAIPSLVAILALAAVFGAAVQLAILRPLSGSSVLVRVIATLGILSLLEGVGDRWWGTPEPVSSLLPQQAVHLGGGLVVGADRLILLGMALALTAGLHIMYRRTRYGLATSAVAEDPAATAALGWSTNLIAAANWSLGSVLAALAGILLAPIVSLGVDNLTLMVVPALAAALIGQFRSFWLTSLAGLGIGLVESELTLYVHTAGWSESVPFLAIIFIVIVRGRPLPLRGELRDRPIRVGAGTARFRFLLPVLILCALVLGVLSQEWLAAVATSALLGIVCLSLVVIVGYTGQLSLAQYSLCGIGALVAGWASGSWGAPLLLTIFIAVVVTALAGLLIAIPALRCRGVDLAIATLGVGLVIQDLLIGNQWLSGGAAGLTTRNPTLFGQSVSFIQYPVRYDALVITFFVVCAVGIGNVRKGATGRRMLAVRCNERAAESLGISVYAVKTTAFACSAGLAGLAGALAAYQFQYVDLSPYTAIGSVNVLVDAVLGGIGFLGGAAVGGIVGAGGVLTQAVSYLGSGWTAWLTVFTGAGVLLTLLVHPEGVFARNADLLRTAVGRLRTGRRPQAFVDASSGTVHTELVRPVPLRAQNISVAFGGVKAVDQVDLGVSPGEIVGLIGPNGAGKTTLMDAICGLVPYEGSVLLESNSIDGLPLYRRVRLGVARTFQSEELFDDLTVLENLCAAGDSRSRLDPLLEVFRPRRSRVTAEVSLLARELGLTAILGHRPDELTVGQRRLVAIARSLVQRPSLLLLDEPAAGLTPAERDEIGNLIRRLATARGVAVLLVEHDISLVMRISDRIVALRSGSVIADGTPAEVRQHPQVIESYLGEAVSEPVPEATELPVSEAR